MRKYILFVLILLMSVSVFSQVNGKKFGIGFVLGEPTGLSMKYYNSSTTAFVFGIGSSYFGSPRIGMDYVWHFNAFESRVVDLYAGPGVVIGVGEGRAYYFENKGHDHFYFRDNGTGIAARGILGIDFTPRNTPLDIFLEIGLLLGISPNYGTAFDTAIGLRFYP